MVRTSVGVVSLSPRSCHNKVHITEAVRARSIDMDDGDGADDAACYASGSGGRLDRMPRLSTLPQWECTKESYNKWSWQAQQHISTTGLHDTYWGVNRKDKSCGDVKVESRYERLSRQLFTVLLFMMGGTKPDKTQECMSDRIQNDFGQDRDGYALAQYIHMWANDLTNAEIKLLKAALTQIHFKATQTPAQWERMCQKLQMQWERIPVAKRGGGEPELCEMLLDKMPEECDLYVTFVRAAAHAAKTILDDYQDVVKSLCDQHTERWAKATLNGKGRVQELRGEAQFTTGDENEGAEAMFSQQGKGGGKSTGRPAGDGKADVKRTCYRCGKTGHIKSDCKATCSKCGLQRCGGVKSLGERCMVMKGIPMPLAKVMSAELKTEIIAKAKLLGFHSKWPSGVVNMCTHGNEDDLDECAVTVEEFFELEIAEALVTTLEKLEISESNGVPKPSEVAETLVTMAEMPEVSTSESAPIKYKCSIEVETVARRMVQAFYDDGRGAKVKSWTEEEIIFSVWNLSDEKPIMNDFTLQISPGKNKGESSVSGKRRREEAEECKLCQSREHTQGECPMSEWAGGVLFEDDHPVWLDSFTKVEAEGSCSGGQVLTDSADADVPKHLYGNEQGEVIKYNTPKEKGNEFSQDELDDIDARLVPSIEWLLGSKSLWLPRSNYPTMNHLARGIAGLHQDQGPGHCLAMLNCQEALEAGVLEALEVLTVARPATPELEVLQQELFGSTGNVGEETQKIKNAVNLRRSVSPVGEGASSNKGNVMQHMQYVYLDLQDAGDEGGVALMASEMKKELEKMEMETAARESIESEKVRQAMVDSLASEEARRVKSVAEGQQKQRLQALHASCMRDLVGEMQSIKDGIPGACISQSVRASQLSHARAQEQAAKDEAMFESLLMHSAEDHDLAMGLKSIVDEKYDALVAQTVLERIEMDVDRVEKEAKMMAPETASDCMSEDELMALMVDEHMPTVDVDGVQADVENPLLGFTPITNNGVHDNTHATTLQQTFRTINPEGENSSISKSEMEKYIGDDLNYKGEATAEATADGSGQDSVTQNSKRRRSRLEEENDVGESQSRLRPRALSEALGKVAPPTSHPGLSGQMVRSPLRLETTRDAPARGRCEVTPEGVFSWPYHEGSTVELNVDGSLMFASSPTKTPGAEINTMLGGRNSSGTNAVKRMQARTNLHENIAAATPSGLFPRGRMSSGGEQQSAGRPAATNDKALGSGHGPDSSQTLPKPKATALNRNRSEGRGSRKAGSTTAAAPLETPESLLSVVKDLGRMMEQSEGLTLQVAMCRSTAKEAARLADAACVQGRANGVQLVSLTRAIQGGQAGLGVDRGRWTSGGGTTRASGPPQRSASATVGRVMRTPSGQHRMRPGRQEPTVNRAEQRGGRGFGWAALVMIAAAIASALMSTAVQATASPSAPRWAGAKSYMMSAVNDTDTDVTNSAVIDGGCTHTAWNDYAAFEKESMVASIIPNVLVGDGKRLPVKGEGTVSVLVEGTNGRAVPYKRRNVLYVPDLSRNLISERQEWERHATRIIKEDVRTMTWPMKGGTSTEARIRDAGRLYVLRYQHKQAEANLAESDSAEYKYKLWHARCGDAHPRKMKLIGECTEGTPLGNMSVAALAKSAGVCSHCARGKMRRMHVKESTTRITRPHEMVQMDVWGKYRVASAVNKSYYAISFVDVATGHVMVYPRASHTASGLIDVTTLYQGDMGHAIGILRTDNGPEMLSDEYQMWLAGQKITWQRSTRYVHEEIGHVERRWGMLVPMARTMLLRWGGELRFWADAMVYSAWLLNRTPDTVHGEETACTGKASTPYERLYGKRPSLAKARVFGCKAWAYKDKEERQSKMHEVSVEGRFVGMEPNGAGWLIYANGRYYASRRAVFDESGVLEDSTAVSDDSGGAVEAPVFDTEEMDEPRALRSRAPAEGIARGDQGGAPTSQPEGARIRLTVPVGLGGGDNLTTVVNGDLLTVALPAGASEGTSVEVHAPSNVDRPAAGHDSGAPVGMWIEVYWTEELVWYEAKVLAIRVVKGGDVQHQVEYPADAKVLWHNLSNERWRVAAKGQGLIAEACYILDDDMKHGGVWGFEAPGASGVECLALTDDGQCENPEGFGHAYLASADRVKHVIMPTGMAAITIPKTHREACEGPYSQNWLQAEEVELDTHEGMGTWDWLCLADKPPGEKLYKCKWAYDCKTVDGVLDKFKARLCFVGIEQGANSYEAVFSTCVRYASIRALIAYGAVHDHELFNVDIKAAYLSQELDRDLYMRSPPGHERIGPNGEPMCTVLRRALYGCKQSGRLFRKGLDKWLRGYGFNGMIHDDCMYIRRTEDGGVIIIGVWVDDIIAAASSPAIRASFIKALREEFTVDDRGDLEWALGLKVQRDRSTRTATISCGARIRALGEKHGIDLKTHRKYETPSDSTIMEMADGEELNLEAAEKCRGLIGALMYISSTCRPDIAHTVHRLSRLMSKANKKVWACALRALVYLLNSADLGISYGGDRPEAMRLSAVHKPFEAAGVDGLGLSALSDSNWETGPSVSGYAILLAGGVIAWCSKRQPSTSLSSTEAETFAAAAATAETVWARGLLSEFGLPQAGPTVLWVDNSGAVAIVSDAASVGRSRHIARRAHFCLEAAATGSIRPRWLSTEANVADLLTKSLERKRFVRLRSYLMNEAAAGSAGAPSGQLH